MHWAPGEVEIHNFFSMAMVLDAPAKSRKRPFAAIADGGIGGDGDGTEMVHERNRSHHSDKILSDYGAAPQTPARPRSRVGNDEEKGSDDGHERSRDEDEGCGCGCDGDSDEADVPEIIDLQKALEFLVSERDIEAIYNDGSRSNEQTSAESKPMQSDDTPVAQCNNKRVRGDKGEQQLRAIPNLVNRIIMEHYSSSRTERPSRHDCKAAGQTVDSDDAAVAEGEGANRRPTRSQKEQMMQLLLAVIAEFSEPHFARLARRKRRERDRKLLARKGRTQQPTREEKGPRRKESRSGRNESAVPQDDPSSAFAFDERAASWATSCLTQLLRPAPSEDDYGIPELDALLAASGPHDGMDAERRMQGALMHGLRGRHILQSMGMFEK